MKVIYKIFFIIIVGCLFSLATVFRAKGCNEERHPQIIVAKIISKYNLNYEGDLTLWLATFEGQDILIFSNDKNDLLDTTLIKSPYLSPPENYHAIHSYDPRNLYPNKVNPHIPDNFIPVSSGQPSSRPNTLKIGHFYPFVAVPTSMWKGTLSKPWNKDEGKIYERILACPSDRVYKSLNLKGDTIIDFPEHLKKDIDNLKIQQK